MTLFLGVAMALLFSAKGMSLYVDMELLAVGDMAPSFKLPRLDGRTQRLSDMRGAVTWLFFGRTDDDETRIQIREARKMAENFRRWDIRILFIAQSQSEEVLQRFVEEHGCAAAIMLDKGGRTAAKYHASYWPTSYLIDKTGRIRAAFRGLVRAGNDRFEALVGELLRSGTRHAPAGK